VAILGSRRRWAAALVLALSMPAAFPAQFANEYEVKAAFLFNFTRFVDWMPSSRNAPFCIGVYGADPFHGALEEVVKGRSMGGRAIAVKHFKPEEDPADCEIVFISVVDPRKVAKILIQLKDAPILTVGDAPGFCAMGGVIGFSVEDNKVKLQINPGAALRAHLQVSSKLLSLASLVRETGE
jgi:YfiR/HmsC-like